MNEAHPDRSEADHRADVPAGFALRWRPLRGPRRTTGRERRWLDPEHGLLKRAERLVDRFTARYVFPHLLGVWHPYCWLLPRRFSLAVATVTPPLWPDSADDLRVLLLSDIHTGAFLHPEVLRPILEELMCLRPDLVAVTGDIVEGRVEDLDGFLPVLAVLAGARLGAWYCFGNHDYFTGEPDRIRDLLESIHIRALRNESRVLRGGRGDFVIGGIDDRTLGTPDWRRLGAAHGSPHLLLAHNPDDFYEAERHGVALVLSGHTHGGQIRFPGGPPIVRQSRFCLDEGLYVHGSTMLAVTRGLGAVGLPWRMGANPEAVLLRIRAASGDGGRNCRIRAAKTRPSSDMGFRREARAVAVPSGVGLGAREGRQHRLAAGERISKSSRTEPATHRASSIVGGQTRPASGTMRFPAAHQGPGRGRRHPATGAAADGSAASGCT